MLISPLLRYSDDLTLNVCTGRIRQHVSTHCNVNVSDPSQHGWRVQLSRSGLSGRAAAIQVLESKGKHESGGKIREKAPPPPPPPQQQQEEQKSLGPLRGSTPFCVRVFVSEPDVLFYFCGSPFVLPVSTKSHWDDTRGKRHTYVCSNGTGFSFCFKLNSC